MREREADFPSLQSWFSLHQAAAIARRWERCEGFSRRGCVDDSTEGIGEAEGALRLLAAERFVFDPERVKGGGMGPGRSIGVLIAMHEKDISMA